MPSKKPKKLTEQFITSVEMFADLVATLTSAEIFDRNTFQRGGSTTYKISLRPGEDGMPPTKAARFGKRMAWHFQAFYTPTHYERYEILTCKYQRGEGFFVIEGRV